jgi:Co/Zn/Cd efflux system component
MAMADKCCSSDDRHGHAAPAACAERQAGHGALPTASVASVGACCAQGVPVFDGVDSRYKAMLWIVIAINGAMFLTEAITGQLAGSQALKADALDFLADTVTYGLSLAVIGTSLRTRAAAALLKGMSLTLMAAWVLGSTVYQTFVLGLPRADVMGGVGILALAANLASVLLLLRYKDGDANVRSVWLCSRNDAIGNVAVMLAAFAVWSASSAWPDLGVAALMAGVFLTSSIQILRQAWSEHRRGDAAATGDAPSRA